MRLYSPRTRPVPICVVAPVVASPQQVLLSAKDQSLIIMSCHGFPQRLLGHLRSIFFKVEQIRVKNSNNNK